ncbi:MAG: hypothetical protein ACOZNI_16890 [Myxococcota bacterium]
MTIYALMLGCAFDENLPEKDLVGKVILPAAAVTRMTVADPDGDGTLEEPVETEDVRLIGPVWLGAFSAIDTNAFEYPHPAMGPIVDQDTPGYTFPYGGTSVGRFDFGCYESVACRVTTGRFEGYDDVLEYFANFMGRPVVGVEGELITSASAYQQACYDYFEVTSDEEVSFIGVQDFAKNDDGDYEATFAMPHTFYVEGMTIWGWMDAPQISTTNVDINGSFSSCRSDGGREFTEYDENFYEGRPYTNLLGYPSSYIADGDWTTAGAVVGALDEDGNVPSVTVTLDFEVGADVEEE